MASEVGTAAGDLARRCAEATLRVMPSVNRWVAAQVLGERLGGDLSLRQLTVLYLIREETPTLGYLARRLMVTPAVVTGIVDRLEKRGYVQRRADTEDRRVVRLALTDAGRAQSLAVQQQLVAKIAARLAAYPAEQVAELLRGLALLERLLQDLEHANGHNVGVAAGTVESAPGSGVLASRYRTAARGVAAGGALVYNAKNQLFAKARGAAPSAGRRGWGMG